MAKTRKKSGGPKSNNRGTIVIKTTPNYANSDGNLKVTTHDGGDQYYGDTKDQEYAHYMDAKGKNIDNTGVYFTWKRGLTPHGIEYFYAEIN